MSEGTVTVLRVEHPVPDFEAWKRDGFDRDPVGREQGGVRRYRVLRSAGFGPFMAVVELEFDSRAEAESFAGALGDLWRRVQDRFGWRELPEAQLYELTEVCEYR
jgi:hypothetical protein